MAKWAYLNDNFIAEEKALIHFKDLSFQRGYGIFDFFRLSGEKPLFLEDYLDRFFSSAEGMRLPLPLERNKLKSVITALIERNNMPDSGIRLSLTGGYGDDGFSIGQPNFLISQHSFTPPTSEQVEKGITLFSYPHQRQLPHIKSIDYLMAVWLQPQRQGKGADDILYHQNGIISECPRSNFFLVTGENKIITPAENVLKGITRAKVLVVAKKEFQVEERAITLEEVKTAREAFITSTTKQVLPIRQIDDTVYSSNEISLRLLDLFRDACLSSLH